ncbi:MAG TPA: hypothetical protein VIC26_12520 [Marinagarivorans sp.]
MLSTQISQDLISTLALRARGNRTSQLFDNAASLLANQLGLDTVQALNTKEQAALQRSEWLDRQVIDFLKQYPKALGIELGAGVSTRFHRISNTLAWPQFRWADINTPETHAFSQSLLPITDNYRSIGCDMYQHDWLFRAGWQPGLPLLIVLESPAACESRELAQLLKALRSRVTQCDSPLHIVASYDARANTALTATLNALQPTAYIAFETSWARTLVSKVLALLGAQSPFPQWRGQSVRDEGDKSKSRLHAHPPKQSAPPGKH